MWFKILKQPFPINTWRPYWLRAVGFGVFVFLFLFLFKPFNLHYYHPDKLAYASFIYGFITGVVIYMGSILLIKVIAPRINEERWTLGKQILWNTLLMVCITWLNILVTQFMYNVVLPLWWQLDMLKWVFTLGIIPVAIAELVTYNLYLQRNLKSAAQLSKIVASKYAASRALNEKENTKQAFLENSYSPDLDMISERITEMVQEKPEEEDSVITLIGENQGDKIELLCDNLLSVQALDNYVNVFWENNGTLQTNMLRNTLTNIAEQVPSTPYIFRTHRGWLVNIKRVRHVEGNAQGLKLSLDLMQQQIPVSRANIQTYRQLAEQYSFSDEEITAGAR